MNRKNFKTSLRLAAAVISALLVSEARADDMMPLEDSFLNDPPAAQNAAAPDPFAASAADDPFANVPQPEAVAAPAPAPVLNLAPPSSSFASVQSQMSAGTSPADQFLGKLSSDVFREMAEIEQENNTLMLQLKRDKLRAEIDALKMTNRQALFNEIERREKMTQARLEWELEQDLKRQAAIERKQQSEIRQKQIEAALKREEERRIQREKDEEMARLNAEKEKEKEEKRQKLEEQKKERAISLVQVNRLKPTLMAVTRPLKPKRIPSASALMQTTNLGDNMLLAARQGQDIASLIEAAKPQAVVEEVKVEEAPKPEEQPAEEKIVEKPAPIEDLYILKGIHGIAGRLIVKLIPTDNESKTIYQREGGQLPSGHKIVKIYTDSIVTKKDEWPEETLFFSGSAMMMSENKKEARPESKNNDKVAEKDVKATKTKPADAKTDAGTNNPEKSDAKTVKETKDSPEKK